MNILRRASTTRLAIAATLVVVAAVAASMALASRSSPAPPKRSLAAAIHHALAGPRVAGVTARIRFSNHLLPSGALPDSGQPLLAGATGRLWATGGKVRLELQADNGDTEIGFDGTTLVVYDVATSTAYEMQVPRHPDAPPRLGERPRRAVDRRHPARAGPARGPRDALGCDRREHRRPAGLHCPRLAQARRRPPRRGRARLRRKPCRAAAGRRSEPGRLDPRRRALGDRHQLRQRRACRSGRPSRAGHQDRPRAPTAGAGAQGMGGPCARSRRNGGGCPCCPVHPGSAAVARRPATAGRPPGRRLGHAGRHGRLRPRPRGDRGPRAAGRRARRRAAAARCRACP